MTAVVLLLVAGAVVLWPARTPIKGSGALEAAAGLPGRPGLPGRLRRWLHHDWQSDRNGDTSAAEFADALALALRSGLPGPAAWALAARSVPDGEPGLGCDDVLSRAWRLSHELGAPLVATIESVSATMRARTAAQGRQRSLLAGPKASMLMLTLLPIAGPLLAPLVGLNVLHGNGIGRFTVPAGLLLTLAGWRWSGWILRRAARPVPVLQPPTGAPR